MKRNAVYRRGWNACLLRVLRALRALPSQGRSVSLSDAQTACRSLRLRKPRGGTNAQLAAKYGASLRTINNWRKAGCPFERGQAAVLNWLSKRPVVPRKTREQFKEQLDRLFFRNMRPEFRGLRAEAQAIRITCKANGIPVPDWLQSFGRHFRARRNSPLVIAAFKRIEAAGVFAPLRA